MKSISLYKISKWCIIVFLIYDIWFKYAYEEKAIVLYGSVVAAAGFMLVDVLLSKKDILRICPYGVLLNIFMCAYSVLTGIKGVRNQDALFNAVKTYLSFSAVCVVICYISKEEKEGFEWLANILICIYIVCAFYVLTRGVYYRGYGYVLGPDQNPNTLALNMDIGLFCIAYKTRKTVKTNYIYIGLAILFLYVIIGCGSRKCLIAAAIICGLWLYPMIKEIMKKKDTFGRISILLLSFAVIGVIYFYIHTIYKNTDSYKRMITLGAEGELSSEHRMLYYQYALDYFCERPFFGIGLAQFTYWNPLHQYAHSTYAEALADWGFVGCSLYFIPVITTISRIVKLIRYKEKNYVEKIIFALFAMELFLGVGQIWFYGMEHLLVWTIIYLYLDLAGETTTRTRRQYKYVKA